MSVCRQSSGSCHGSAGLSFSLPLDVLPLAFVDCRSWVSACACHASWLLPLFGRTFVRVLVGASCSSLLFGLRLFFLASSGAGSHPCSSIPPREFVQLPTHWHLRQRCFLLVALGLCDLNFGHPTVFGLNDPSLCGSRRNPRRGLSVWDLPLSNWVWVFRPPLFGRDLFFSCPFASLRSF